MSGFGTLMLIFAVCVSLAGLFMFTGHEFGVMTGRPAFKNLSKVEWKNIGKWTMIASIPIFILALIGFILIE